MFVKKYSNLDLLSTLSHPLSHPLELTCNVFNLRWKLTHTATRAKGQLPPKSLNQMFIWWCMLSGGK